MCRPPAKSPPLLVAVLLFLLVVLVFAAAELMRTSNVKAATLLPMLGWLLFAAFVVLDTGVGRGWAALLRRLGCVLVTSLAAGGVLLVFFLRSRILEAGPMTDAVYTYLGPMPVTLREPS